MAARTCKRASRNGRCKSLRNSCADCHFKDICAEVVGCEDELPVAGLSPLITKSERSEKSLSYVDS
jgi:hypothetical protein